jgi:MFS family permease
MRSSGPLTDRVGGGPVVVAGLLILSLATLPFTQVGPSTSYALLSLALLGRGVGLGFTMMPAMASAFALLERGQVPRATPMLNVPGASVASVPPGARAHVAGPIADAFGHTYWWATALTLIALPAALALWREQRRARAMERAEAGLRGPPAPLG